MAAQCGAVYSSADGISPEEITASKSPFLELIASGFDHIASLFPGHSNTVDQFDEIYKNAYLDFVYRESNIRVHVRNVGLGFERPEHQAVRITSELRRETLRFRVVRRKAECEPSKVDTNTKLAGVPSLLKRFVPYGVLRSLSSGDVELTLPGVFWNSRYAFITDHPTLAESILKTSQLHKHLENLGDLFVLSTGYLDSKSMSETPILELYADIKPLSMESLLKYLHLIQCCLDIVEYESSEPS